MLAVVVTSGIQAEQNERAAAVTVGLRMAQRQLSAWQPEELEVTGLGQCDVD